MKRELRIPSTVNVSAEIDATRINVRFSRRSWPLFKASNKWLTEDDIVRGVDGPETITVQVPTDSLDP